MRLLDLYLVSRRARRALLVIVASAGLAGLLLAFSSDPESRRLILIVVPLMPAVVIGVSAWSPFGEVEHTASQQLLPLRLAHLGGLLACAALALGLANLVAWDPDSRWLLVRNLAGYTGLAFIGARVFGPAFASTFAWALPIGYAALVWAAADEVWWSWAKRPPASDSATVIALALLVTGLLAILPAGRWRRIGEGDVA